MLTGNEPVSTGNLRASLGNFAHHRAGACYEKNDGKEMETDYVMEEKQAVPIVTGRAPAVGGSFSDMSFTPDKPGIFEVSLSIKQFNARKSNGSVKKAAIVARVDGFDYVLFAGSIDSVYSDISASKVVPVTETGVSVMVAGDYTNNEWGNFYATITNPKMSIIEI